MKKIISALILAAVCFSLCSCFGTEPEGFFGIDEAYVGEWLTYRGVYTSAGSITEAKLTSVVLNEDGTAHLGDVDGTWTCYIPEDPSQPPIWITVELPNETLRLFVWEVDGYVCLTRERPPMPFYDIYDIFFRESTENYAAAHDKVAREWYNTSGDVLDLTDDGTIFYNGELQPMKWSITCMGPYIAIEYGGDLPARIKLVPTRREDDVGIDIRGIGGFCSSEYAILITVDNWQEYFGSELNEVVDISYEIQYETNEWGEKVDSHGCDAEQIVTLKDSALYLGGGSRLTFEFECGAEADTFIYDEDLKLAVKNQTDESPLAGEKITVNLSGGRNSILQRSDPFYISSYSTTYMPSSGIITRMKGILFKTELLSIGE